MAESTDNLQQAEVGMTIPVKINVWQFWSVIYHRLVHSWLVIYTVGLLICCTCNQAFLAVSKKLKPEKTEGFQKNSSKFPKNSRISQLS